MPKRIVEDPGEDDGDCDAGNDRGQVEDRAEHAARAHRVWFSSSGEHQRLTTMPSGTLKTV